MARAACALVLISAPRTFNVLRLSYILHKFQYERDGIYSGVALVRGVPERFLFAE